MKDTLGRNNRKLEDARCPQCGASFRPYRHTSHYCSRACSWANNGGQNRKPETWWVNSRGYMEGKIWLPDGTQIRIKRHRFIAEGVLGRALHSWEDVHHIDGNKLNNAPENLQVLSHGDHSRVSNSSRDFKRGYKLNLSDEQRHARSLRAIASGLSEMGRAAIATH